jgi:putative ABC transport system substrate-binding protein
MRRRNFITLLGGAAVAWPLAASPQKPARKIVKLGFLQAFRNENTVAFVQGLRSAG